MSEARRLSIETIYVKMLFRGSSWYSQLCMELCQSGAILVTWNRSWPGCPCIVICLRVTIFACTPSPSLAKSSLSPRKAFKLNPQIPLFLCSWKRVRLWNQIRFANFFFSKRHLVLMLNRVIFLFCANFSRIRVEAWWPDWFTPNIIRRYYCFTMSR